MLRRCSHPKKEEVRHPASAPPVFFQNSPHVTSLEKGQILWCLVSMKVLGGPNDKKLQHSLISSNVTSLHHSRTDMRNVALRRQLLLIHLFQVLINCEARVHAAAGDWDGLQCPWRREWPEHPLGALQHLRFSLPRSFSEAPGAMREAPQACYTAAESPPCEQGSMGHGYKGQMCAVCRALESCEKRTNQCASLARLELAKCC